MTDRIIRAPWTAEQVTALNAFQQRGGMHPFTCGGDHAPGSPALVAYADGWRCPQPYGEACDYRQDWAHAFMAAAPAVPAGQAPDTDRAPLRTRIAEALAREDAHNWGYDHGFVHVYGGDPETDGFVDAVLAVPVGRGAVLSDVEDAVEGLFIEDENPDERSLGFNAALDEVITELRRMAAAPAVVSAVPGQADGETTDEARLARVREWVTSDVVTARNEFGNGYREAQRDIRDLITGAEQPAAGAQQPKEA